VKDFDAFDAALQDARAALARMADADPADAALASVRRQLDDVHAWTRGGREPAQDEKDRLNFGHIVSRELSGLEEARTLYELASHVIWWGERPSP
jgi:hypothetical protein